MSGSILICPNCEAKLRLKTVPKGRSITCPRCSQVIPVPAPESEATDEYSDDEFDEAPVPPRRGRAPVAASSSRPKAGKKPGKKKKKESNPTMLIVGGTGAAVVAIGLIVVFLMSSGPREPAPQMASNPQTNMAAPSAAHGVPASGGGLPGGGVSPNSGGSVPVVAANPGNAALPSEGTPMPNAPVIAAATPESTPPVQPEPMASNPEDAYLELDDENGPDVHEINQRAVRAALGAEAPPKTAVAGVMDYSQVDDPISIEILLYGQKVQQAFAAGQVKLKKVVDDQGRPLRPAKTDKHEDPLVSMLPLGRLNRQWHDKPADVRLKFVRNPGMKAIGTLEATLVARVPVSQIPLTIKNVPGLVGQPVPDLKPYITKVTRNPLLKDVIIFEFEMPKQYMLTTAAFANGDIEGPVFMASMESGGRVSHAVTFYQIAVPQTFDVACQVCDKYEDLTIPFTLENVPLQN